MYMFDYYMMKRNLGWESDFLKPDDRNVAINTQKLALSAAEFLKVIGKKRTVNTDNKNFTSLLSAQMEALDAARETGDNPFADQTLFPLSKCENGLTVAETKERADQVVGLSQEIADLRQQVLRLQTVDNSVNSTAVLETPDEANVRMIRVKAVITDVCHEKNMKERLSPEDIDAIQRQVESKIHSDRNSSDNDVYQRNRAMLQHLVRRRKYSKCDYKVLKQFWSLLGVSGNLFTFTGQLFDRDYLNTKSDKYYKYVSILTFMLKYQRLSKEHAKLWFKDTKEQDKDEYFFGNWQ
jgi:hypothetical protein